MVSNAVVAFDASLDTMIRAWLHAKRGRSDSEATEQRYAATLATFRALLHTQGIDLDGDTALVATLAQGWAAQSRTGEGVAPATFNQRVNTLSSFYRYIIRQGLFVDEKGNARANPIDRIDRRQVQAYAKARAMSRAFITERLAAIPLDTLTGLRDAALLWLTLTTGRRLSEVAGMRREHLTLADGDKLVVTFPRAKGGKVLRDELAPEVASLLALYLHTLDETMPAHAPGAVWVAIGPHGRGQALHKRSLERICEHRLGTSHFHALRHTFAHAMEDLGAKISEIQTRLGHSSIAVTGVYLASLSSEKNPYAGAIAALFRDEPSA